jgi:hypothetical protein
MKKRHVLEFLENELGFPIDQNSVIEQIGAIEIEAPDVQETETVSTIIGPVAPRPSTSTTRAPPPDTGQRIRRRTTTREDGFSGVVAHYLKHREVEPLVRSAVTVYRSSPPRGGDRRERPTTGPLSCRVPTAPSR